MKSHTLGDLLVVLVVVVLRLVPEKGDHAIDRVSEDGDVARLDAEDIVEAKGEVSVHGLGALHVALY